MKQFGKDMNLLGRIYEATDMQLLGRINETTDIIYMLEKQKRKLVIKYNKRQKKGNELNI